MNAGRGRESRDGDTINVGNGPVGVAVSPDGTRLYVSNSGDGTVYVIAV